MLNPMSLMHFLCASMRSEQFSAPYSMMQLSRASFVSGQAQQALQEGRDGGVRGRRLAQRRVGRHVVHPCSVALQPRVGGGCRHCLPHRHEHGYRGRHRALGAPAAAVARGHHRRRHQVRLGRLRQALQGSRDVLPLRCHVARRHLRRG